ncbi:uncharacterized protein C13orf46 homolog isoform X2 [Prionailurus viverrinus]|uniref:uncharacterized protein C13orf46 homolog isoform X2 n=1 Tax=Prionailurus viverrinus TaxID=61388 RepID=UPI001FF4B2F0|nr:uncharacterized protein C13orf46 homolog isoform X2 [Prionailurus viverrinus]
MMEKDTAAHRRHRPGLGAPPSGGAPRHLKAASEMVELQRSRSVGGLLQKGDPLRCVKKLSRELESEDQGRDLQSDTEDANCKADPEEEKQEKNRDSLRKLDPDGGWAGPAEPELESIKLDEPLGKEVVTGTMKEEKQSEMDMGGSSEDELFQACFRWWGSAPAGQPLLTAQWDASAPSCGVPAKGRRAADPPQRQPQLEVETPETTTGEKLKLWCSGNGQG